MAGEVANEPTFTLKFLEHAFKRWSERCHKVKKNKNLKSYYTLSYHCNSESNLFISSYGIIFMALLSFIQVNENAFWDF